MQNRLIAPSTDFRSVRDGRNSQVYYVDVALDTARSAAAGTALVLPISGNAFYCDANPGDGNAYVHFQDTNFDRAPAPLYVSPGVIFNIPFTQVLIENSAQPGKKIRIAYGIDIDFQPGSVAQIAVTNAGGYTAVRPEAATSTYKSNVIIVANTAETLFTPAANVNGAILQMASFNLYGGASVILAAFLAKNAAPANPMDGEPLLWGGFVNSNAGGSNVTAAMLPQQLFIAAGLGLYFIADNATATTGGASARAARWKLL